MKNVKDFPKRKRTFPNLANILYHTHRAKPHGLQTSQNREGCLERTRIILATEHRIIHHMEMIGRKKRKEDNI